MASMNTMNQMKWNNMESGDIDVGINVAEDTNLLTLTLTSKTPRKIAISGHPVQPLRHLVSLTFKNV